MDDLTTNTSTQTTLQPSQQPPRKSRTGKTVLLILLMLALIVGGIAGGYYWGKMNKDQEVDQAKQTAKQEAQNDTKTDTGNDDASSQTQKTPPKTVTETTCNADELRLEATASSESGAGTLAYDLVLTNSGTRTCILGGFPGVSLVNDNGNMIGSPAERTTNYEEKKLTLAPNGKVKAIVSTSNSSNFSNGECKAGATKLRVYPPNDTGYLSTLTTIDSWCPGFMTSPVLAL